MLRELSKLVSLISVIMPSEKNSTFVKQLGHNSADNTYINFI